MKTMHRFSGYGLRLVSAGLLISMAGGLVISSPVQAAPVLTVSPTSGAVGTEVTIAGSVFDSYKGDIIQVFFNDQEIPEWSPFEIPESGDFEIPYIIPAATPPGSYIIRVEGAVGSTQFHAETVFRVEAPTLLLDVSEGPVGTSVSLTGRGFYSGSTVTVYYHNPAAATVGAERATSTGRFSHSFLIPASTGGPHTVSAVSAEGNTAETRFTVTSAVNLNINLGGPGDVVNITGSGFGFRSEVTVTIDSLVIASAESGDYGGFTVDFNIPDIASGPYDIRIEDELGNIDIATFTITAGASLSQFSGAVGSSLTARGNGFLANGDVTVDFAMLRVATETTDNNGGFTTTFAVPPVGSGVHTVTISDGATTRQITYTIESEAPLVPAHLLPSDAGQTKVNAYLDWEDVTDDSSPVVYHLQVASDPGFSTLVVDKCELTASEYTLGATENLTVGQLPIAYFWRIKSQDAAWNESEWSVPWSFLIGPPPAPVIASVPPVDTAPAQTETGTATEDGEAAIEEEDNSVTLVWEDVASISEPVTYVVQIAEDPDFVNPVLEKTQLTSSGYILTEEELLALKNNTPYYWRVKTVDDDNIESGWSEAASFTFGSSFQWPGWATFLLIGIGVVVITFIAFRVGKRTAFRQPD